MEEKEIEVEVQAISMLTRIQTALARVMEIGFITVPIGAPEAAEWEIRLSEVDGNRLISEFEATTGQKFEKINNLHVLGLQTFKLHPQAFDNMYDWSGNQASYLIHTKTNNRYLL